MQRKYRHEVSSAPGTLTAQSSGSHPRRILLVEDHPVVSKGIAGLINYEADLEVCGTAEDGGSALQQADSLDPDLIVLDLALQGRSGLDVLKEIKARRPAQRVLVLSMYDETIYAPRALKAGASGYVMKQEATETLLTAIRRVLAGGTYLSTAFEKRMVESFLWRRSQPVLDPVERLTDREIEVLRLIGTGQSTHEIAQRLALSSKTVESHRTRIKVKLKLDSVTALMRRAMQIEREQAWPVPPSKS